MSEIEMTETKPKEVKKENEEEEEEEERNEKGEKFVLTEESKELEAELLEALKADTDTNPQQTRACVQYFINQIFQINDVEQTCHLDFYLKVNWIDKQFIGVSDDDFQDMENKTFWKPGVEVVNGIDCEKRVEEDEAYWIEYPEHGIMAYTQRYIGHLSAPMNLKYFPFDFQTLNITFESFHWKASDLKLVPLKKQQEQIPPAEGVCDENGVRIYHWPGMADKVHLPDWDIKMIHAKSFENYYRFEDRNYWQIIVNVHINRESRYYVTQIIVLLAAIFILSLTVCFMDAENIGDRSGFSVTLFLALVAYHFVISTSLPKVSYETSLSKFLFTTYFLVGLTMVLNVLVFMVANYDAEDNTQISDKPAYSIAKIIDWVTLCLLSLFFIVYNIIYYRNAKAVEEKSQIFRDNDLKNFTPPPKTKGRKKKVH